MDKEFIHSNYNSPLFSYTIKDVEIGEYLIIMLDRFLRVDRGLKTTFWGSNVKHLKSVYNIFQYTSSLIGRAQGKKLPARNWDESYAVGERVEEMEVKLRGLTPQAAASTDGLSGWKPETRSLEAPKNAKLTEFDSVNSAIRKLEKLY